MKKLEILLVDDDLIFLMLQKRILLGSGIKSKILSFSAPQEALHYISTASETSIFLIFLDINLAQTNARDFLNEMVELGLDNKTFVVIASSSVNSSDFEIVNDFDCVIDFIEKPISKENIQKICSNPLIANFLEKE